MHWRPLSLQGTTDSRFDEPSEGLPPWLRGPVISWVEGSFYEPRFEGRPPRVRSSALQSLQLALRLEQPPKGASDKRRLAGLITSMTQDDEFALDVIDWMLHCPGHFAWRKRETKAWAEKLGAILREGGSAWEVTPSADAFRLTRRAVGPIADVLENTAPSASRAHSHLSDAWAKLMGRDPDPSGAYRDAVRAVEAVAKPVVLPSSNRATLGQMIAAMRDKPEKWLTTLGTTDDVRAQMEAVWTGQLDRHGTDDELVPLNVSPEEADAAFSTCLTLVRLFAGGHVVQAGDP